MLNPENVEIVAINTQNKLKCTIFQLPTKRPSL